MTVEDETRAMRAQVRQAEAQERLADVAERIAVALEALVPEPGPEPIDDCGDHFGPLYRCTREPEHNGCHEYAVAGKVLTTWP